MSTMTKGERADLLSLVKKREKVMKSQAEERSAALLAEFDAQSAKIHHYDEDAIWNQVFEEAKAAVEKAQEEIAKRCADRGIPPEFAPGIHFGWHGRGHNAVTERRVELRRAAKSKIEAMQKEAVTKIERLSLEAQTQIIASGLDSEAAKAFLDAMPKLEQLMPPVEIGEIQSLIEARHSERKQIMYYN
jgi:hypothetical protein